MKQVNFYWEWLPLPKEQFRILVMIAEEDGEYCGNLTQMCNYFSLTPQSHNRNELKEAIKTLKDINMLQYVKSGNNWNLKFIPKERKILADIDFVKSLIGKDYSSESVAWEQVLKVYLWILFNDKPTVTNENIAADLKISVSTIGKAKNVLSKEYDAISRKRISEKIGENMFRNIGQELTASAWWQKPKKD